RRTSEIGNASRGAARQTATSGSTTLPPTGCDDARKLVEEPRVRRFHGVDEARDGDARFRSQELGEACTIDALATNARAISERSIRAIAGDESLFEKSIERLRDRRVNEPRGTTDSLVELARRARTRVPQRGHYGVF